MHHEAYQKMYQINWIVGNCDEYNLYFINIKACYFVFDYLMPSYAKWNPERWTEENVKAISVDFLIFRARFLNMNEPWMKSLILIKTTIGNVWNWCISALHYFRSFNQDFVVCCPFYIINWFPCYYIQVYFTCRKKNDDNL